MNTSVPESAPEGNRIKLKLGDDEFVVFVGAAFTPTETTRLLVECALPHVKSDHRVLDLGCGTGIVGLAIGRAKRLPIIFLSDIHDESRRAVELNFRLTGQRFEFRGGDLFEPWKGQRFDVIVDDVSGVASSVAPVSRWFQGVPCDSGFDGTRLVCRVLERAGKFLLPGGKLVFPTISLSRTDRILDCARRNFRHVERLGSRDWPMPPELVAQLPLLERYEREGAFSLIRKFGMVIGRTEIFLAEQDKRRHS